MESSYSDRQAQHTTVRYTLFLVIATERGTHSPECSRTCCTGCCVPGEITVSIYSGKGKPRNLLLTNFPVDRGTVKRRTHWCPAVTGRAADHERGKEISPRIARTYDSLLPFTFGITVVTFKGAVAAAATAR